MVGGVRESVVRRGYKVRGLGEGVGECSEGDGVCVCAERGAWVGCAGESEWGC